MSLQTKITLAVVACIAALFGALGYLWYQALDDSSNRTLKERLIIAKMAAQGMDHDLSARLSQLEQFAALGSVNLNDDSLESEKEALRELYLYAGPFTQNVFLLDKNSRLLWTVPHDPNANGSYLSFYPNVIATLQTGSPKVGSIMTPDNLETPTVSLSVAVRNSRNEVVGVVGTNFGPASKFMDSLVQPITLGKSAYSEVVNEDGVVIASTKPGSSDSSYQITEHSERFAALIRKGEAAVRTCHRCHEPQGSAKRQKDVLAFVPLTTAPWGVAIRQPESEAFAPRRELQKRLMTFGVPAVLAALAATWLGARTIVKPIKRLTAASRRIAAGDLEGSIAGARHDELGELANTFEVMRLTIKDSRKKLEERAADIERRNSELSHLSSIGQAVSQSLEIDSILSDALDRMIAMVEAETGAVYLLEEDKGLVLKAQKGEADELSQRAAEMEVGEAFSLSSLAGVGGVDESAKGEAESEALSSCRLPITSKGELLGSLVVARKGHRTFSNEEARLLAAAASTLAMAVSNARLFHQTQQREQEVEALYQIGVKISALLDIDKILAAVIEAGQQLVGSDLVLLSMTDEKSGDIYVRSAVGNRSDRLKHVRLSPGEGVSGKVVTLGEPVASRDYLNDPSFPHLQLSDAVIREEGIRSFLGVPIKVGERVFGALCVADRTSRDYSFADMDLLSRLANQAALAIENARLYSQVQEMAILEERDRLAREMHDGLSQVLGYLNLRTRSVEEMVGKGNVLSAQQEMGEIRKVIRDAYDDVRQGILGLRTAVSPGKDLVTILQEYLQEYSDRSGVAARLVVGDARSTRVPSGAEVQLIRIIQEALANVRKHARASRIEVRFESENGRARIIVEDNGQGFDPGTIADRRRHFGIQTMKERAESVGGALAVESAPGTGTRVIIRIPLANGGAELV